MNKFLAILISLVVASAASAKDISLLNVSYDPTRELYLDFNKAFAAYWKDKTGDVVTIHQSHGGSGSQARSVINGQEADVVTLALASDLDAIADQSHLLPTNWQTLLPNNSTPYTSTIVFLVRKGNPKHIRDWNDLITNGVSIITPNPKSSGGARWNYLAAYGYALKQNNGDEAKAKDFVKALFHNVAVQDSGGRSATITFVQRGIGDVLIAWENEAILSTHEVGQDKTEIVRPSLSILAEPPVAVVQRNAKRHGTEAVAKAYLEYLYTPEGQEIAARNFYRPRLDAVAQKYAAQFPAMKFFTVDELFGSWTSAQKNHFADGGIFDQISSGK